MKTNEEYKQKFIQLVEDKNDFITDVDGFVYWLPSKSGEYFASHHLRWLADELDRRNEKWQKQINDYFANVEQ